MMLTIADDPKTLACALADRLLLEAHAARSRGRMLRIALSGGSTPACLYEELNKRRDLIPWSFLRLYFSDERAVPPDHPDSNFGLAHRLWLKDVGPDAVVYRIRGEQGADQAALDYEETLKNDTDQNGAFDIILLGLGGDGHVASLFPGATLESARRVIAVAQTQERGARISLSFPTLVAARTRIVLTQGESKARVLADNLTKTAQSPFAQLVRSAPTELWLDRAAATGLCPF